jgi:hypothetical protein
MKYYGTNSNGFYIPKEIREKFDLDGTHEQYRVVIKSKSRASANRRWKEVTGQSRDVFYPDYTQETGNKTEIELCDKHGEIISKHRNYTDLNVIVAEIKEYKKYK